MPNLRQCGPGSDVKKIDSWISSFQFTMLYLLWIITPTPVFIPIIHPKLFLFIIILCYLLLFTVVHTLLIIGRRIVHTKDSK